MDYALPRATDFRASSCPPRFTPTPVNPLGAQGVVSRPPLGPHVYRQRQRGRPGEFGVKHIDMMLRPEKLWRIIHGGQAVIPTTFEYARATSLDDALAKLKAANGGGKFIAAATAWCRS